MMSNKTIIKKNKILISCINSHNYGGFAYWSNFLKNFKKHLNKSNNTYYFIVNQNSKISKIIGTKNSILVKKYIHESILLRFLYEQIYIPLFIFKKYDFNIFFNGKNIAPLLIRKKSIIVIRNIEPFFYFKQKFSIKKLISFFKLILTVISLKSCLNVVSVSKNTKKIIMKYTKKRIFLIPNGVSVSKKYKNQWSLNNAKNYILNVSKFVPYANQLKLLEIYNKAFIKDMDLPPLYFAGDVYDKEYFNKVLKFIDQNNLGRKIKFLGYLSKNKLHSTIKNCKLFIFSSELESCPQTILEARFIGCPILSTNIAPMPEFLEKDAMYFNINNINKSVDKLINTIYKTYNQKYLIKNNIPDNYKWSNVCLKYLKIFNDYEK